MKKIFLVNFKEDPNKQKYISEEVSKIGGTKYDDDLLKIFNEMNFKMKYYPIIGSKSKKFLSLLKIFFDIFFKEKAIYFFRYPYIYGAHSKYKKITIWYQYMLFKVMKLSKNKIGVIISDLEYLRYGGNKAIKIDINLLHNFQYIIVHNNKMKEFLISNGLNEETLFNMEVGNNLSDKNIIRKRFLSKTIVFSGNLSKSTFLNKLSDNVNYKINLYGIGFLEKQKNNILEYKGSYSSEDIVEVLEGSFGLMWDGPDINKCTGPFCEFDYLKIINPSKFSQYIAAGLPIIAWNESAVADIIKKYNIGFIVSNLMEIDGILNNLTEKKYNIYLKNVIDLRKKVVKGYHFKKVINEVIEVMDKKNKIV